MFPAISSNTVFDRGLCEKFKGEEVLQGFHSQDLTKKTEEPLISDGPGYAWQHHSDEQEHSTRRPAVMYWQSEKLFGHVVGPDQVAQRATLAKG